MFSTITIAFSRRYKQLKGRALYQLGTHLPASKKKKCKKRSHPWAKPWNTSMLRGWREWGKKKKS